MSGVVCAVLAIVQVQCRSNCALDHSRCSDDSGTYRGASCDAPLWFCLCKAPSVNRVLSLDNAISRMPIPFSHSCLQTGAKPRQETLPRQAPLIISWLSTPVPAPPQPRQPRPPRRKRVPRAFWSIIHGACFFYCAFLLCLGGRGRAETGQGMPTCTHSACPMPSTRINRGAYTTARTVQVTKIFELDAHVERLATTAALMWPDQGTHNGRGRGKGIRQGARSKATSSCSSDFGLKVHSLRVCNKLSKDG